MKRLSLILFGVMCGIVFSIAPVLSCRKINVSYADSSGNFLIEVQQNKFDIVDSTAGGAGLPHILHSSPFDFDNQKMFDGYTFVPSANAKGEIYSTFSFSAGSFVPKQNSSVYMWIYFPEILYCDLKISFFDDSNNSISWLIESSNLVDMVTQNYTLTFQNGYRLFEFLFSKASVNGNITNIYQTTFTKMGIFYTQPTPIDSEVSKSLSFYNVYMASSYLEQIGIVYYQPYAIYKTKENFESTLKGIYINDDFKINGIYDVFDYVIVGNNNLKDYNTNNLSWSLIINDATNKKIDFSFGELYTFKNKGWSSLSVKLVESDNSTENIIIHISYPFYVENFNIGSFSNTEYYFEPNKQYMVSFKIVDNFEVDDLKVYTSDKNIADVSYYVQGTSCYITIDAKQEGNIKLIVEGIGNRLGVSDTNSYKVSVDVCVEKVEDSVSKNVLWWIFGGFCGFFIIFLIISFVKARHFSVK